MHFLADGALLFTESLVGENQPVPLTTRFPVLPGETSKLGDGGLYRYDHSGKLLAEYQPQVHGGMSGSMAVTHSVLAGDGNRLIYVSETGPRLMHYDLESAQQLPDIRSYPDGQMQMFFDLAALAGKRLLLSRGNRLEVITEDGQELQTFPLQGFGWSVVAKVSLTDGSVAATTMVAEKCMAGIAVYK